MDLPGRCNTLVSIIWFKIVCVNTLFNTLFFNMFKVSDPRLKLSDEDKRQIAISRLLLKEPRTMIFDEGEGNPTLDEIKKRNDVISNKKYLVFVFVL